MTRCRTEIRTYHLLDDERMRYVLSYGRGFVSILSLTFQISFTSNKMNLGDVKKYSVHKGKEIIPSNLCLSNLPFFVLI